MTLCDDINPGALDVYGGLTRTIWTILYSNFTPGRHSPLTNRGQAVGDAARRDGVTAGELRDCNELRRF